MNGYNDVDHEENMNLAGAAEYTAIEEQLSTQLRQAFEMVHGSE